MSELKIEIPVQAKLDSKSSKGLESQISGAVENKDVRNKGQNWRSQSGLDSNTD